MKKILMTIIAFLLCIINTYADRSNYYYNYEERAYLNFLSNKMLITFENNITENRRDEILQHINNFIITREEKTRANISIILIDPANESVLVNELYNFPEVLYAARMYRYQQNDDEHLVGISNQIAVQVKQGVTEEDVKTVVHKLGCHVKEKSTIRNGRYVVTCSKNDDVIGKGNELYESGLFLFTQPNFFRTNILASNDPLYSSQWYLNYPTNHAADNNIEDVHQHITMGRKEIKIAVVDEGTTCSHEDLDGNILLSGFDASGTGDGCTYYGHHGNKVIGIIAAIPDNSKGIKGVAPGCSAVSVAVDFGGTWDVDAANGIDWAAHIEKVDVMNLSFGWSLSGSPSPLLGQSIDDAVLYGRGGNIATSIGGLGCVMVVASGNSGQNAITFPCTKPNVICVGGSNKTGKRSNYSNYGNTLDIVAPVGDKDFAGVGEVVTTYQGTNQYTTNPPDQGTSFAAPQVAGVAGLILSVNPCLDWTAVKRVLELTADKSRPDLYQYCTDGVTGHGNGTWNEEMGHGKLNAGNAVRMAIDLLGANNISPATFAGMGLYTFTLNTSAANPQSCNSSISSGTYASAALNEFTYSFSRAHCPTCTYTATSNGVSNNTINDGSNYAQVTYSGSTVTVTTYNWTIGSTDYPVISSNIVFNIMADKRSTYYFQNITETNFSQDFKNVEPIEAGYNVTSAISPGNYVLNSGNTVRFISKKTVSLMPGFVCDGHNNNYFEARIGHYNPCYYNGGAINYPNGLEKRGDSTIENSLAQFGLELRNSAKNIRIYPNPNNGSFTIEIPQGGEYDIRVVNMLGSTVYETKLKDERKREVQLDNKLPSGTYTIHIRGKGVNHIEKLTITK